MTSTHDKTMLSHLGFADKDKKNPLHDLACRYAVHNAQSIVRRCMKDDFEKGWLWDGKVKATQEYHLLRDEKFTVGFIDVLLRWRIEYQHYKTPEHRTFCDLHAIVEAKISPVSTGDAIRQMKLYSHYYEPPSQRERPNFYYLDNKDRERSWASKEDIDRLVSAKTSDKVLLTHYTVSQHDIDALTDARILHLHLGDNFSKWCEADAIPEDGLVEL